MIKAMNTKTTWNTLESPPPSDSWIINDYIQLYKYSTQIRYLSID